MGDMDLLRPLGRAGVPCSVVAPPTDPVRYSRFTRAVVPAPSPVLSHPESTDHGPLVEAMLDFARHQDHPPVLFYEDDWHLLFVSRNRDRLRTGFSFVIGEAEMIEDLMDKGRFQALAERVGLPVPRGRRIRPADGFPAVDAEIEFPAVVKPVPGRSERWQAVTNRKALLVQTPAALRALWPALVDAGTDVLLQALVPGPESAIESYHVYVGANGEIVGEFTGRKVRTYPVEHGHSTALALTASAEVASLGRDLVRRIGLTGVAKFDFKRGPDGELRLLEVNPRFNLWHHMGALAGVNLPALVYADLSGRPRPPVVPARESVTWCVPWLDAAAARASDVALGSWLRWTVSCDIKTLLSWDDPMPFVRGKLVPRLARRMRKQAAADP